MVIKKIISRLISDDKFYLCRQNFSSVRTFWENEKWTFFLCPISNFKKTFQKQKPNFFLERK